MKFIMQVGEAKTTKLSVCFIHLPNYKDHYWEIKQPFIFPNLPKNLTLYQLQSQYELRISTSIYNNTFNSSFRAFFLQNMVVYVIITVNLINFPTNIRRTYVTPYDNMTSVQFNNQLLKSLCCYSKTTGLNFVWTLLLLSVCFCLETIVLMYLPL